MIWQLFMDSNEVIPEYHKKVRIDGRNHRKQLQHIDIQRKHSNLEAEENMVFVWFLFFIWENIDRKYKVSKTAEGYSVHHAGILKLPNFFIHIKTKNISEYLHELGKWRTKNLKLSTFCLIYWRRKFSLFARFSSINECVFRLNFLLNSLHYIFII